MRPAFGDWRSLVAHFVRDEGVGGSNPLSPTKFEKPAQRAGFFAFVPKRMRTSGGREVRPERSERTLRQQRPAGRATQWRVILYHRPNSKSLLNEQAFLHLWPVRMRTSGGRRFDSSEARERCVSNGPQGEPRSGESSSITDQIRKACSMSRLFCI